MTILNIQFDDVHFFNQVKFGSINFQPLKFLFKKKPSNLKSIDQLFENDLASVQEIGIEGRVEEVRVNNFSKDFLFISDGEAIIGAKQNRIAERSVIIAPFYSQKIPVKCVEQNRWNYEEGMEFAKSDFVLNPKAREEKAELLKKGENNKIQSVVWKNINDLIPKYYKNNKMLKTGSAGLLAACLELTKEGILNIEQKKIFGELLIKKNN